MDDDRRLIEETFPIKEVAEAVKKDGKEVIRNLHKWWARRPTGITRAVCYATLIPFSKNSKYNTEQEKLIVELSKSSSSDNQIILRKAKNELKKNNASLKTLDPFSGGGSHPLESLRLGCDSFGIDYNPISVIILKSMMSYPQKYKTKDFDKGLIKDFQKYSHSIFQNAKNKLEKFYSIDSESQHSNVYIWCNTLECQNPSCGIEIPLIKTKWLLKTKNNKIALYPKIVGKEIEFSIVGNNYDDFPKDFDPKNGTIDQAIITCPKCGNVIKGNETRQMFIDGKIKQKPIVKILENNNTKKKSYVPINANDIKILDDVSNTIKTKREKILQETGIDPIPQEPFPKNVKMVNTMLGSAQNYNFFKWSDLFNQRQLLTVLTFAEEIRKTINEIKEKENDIEYVKAISIYLAINFDNLLRLLSVNTRYRSDTGATEKIFQNPAIKMVWDYAEVNPLNSNSSWITQTQTICSIIDDCSKIENPAEVEMGNAVELQFEDNYFDAVITDPPYYDVISYSNFSDFFYVWLKKIIGDLFPELFGTILTPKTDEAVAYSVKNEQGQEVGNQRYDGLISKSLKEIYRVLKPDGIAVIVYAYKTTEGWEVLVEALLKSNLIITASWPIETEQKGRIASQEKAALASSIYMVCRKWKKEPHCTYNDVKKEMQDYLDKKLDFLWTQDITGADFFISAIGSAIEVFGKYERITDYEDKPIQVSQLLEDVRKIVSEYAIKKVLRGDIGGEISIMTRFYVLWRSAYRQAKVPYDDARKLATSLGVNLEQEWNKGFIKKDKEFVRVIGPEDRSVDEIKDPTELIDVLHKVLILWRNTKKEAWEKLLTETGYANNDTFRRVGQAIRESLPNEIEEKRMLDGFLTGFTESGKTDGKQTKLF